MLHQRTAGEVTLTAERLREVLHYNSETGNFTWRIPRRRVHAGDVAGSRSGKGYFVIRVDYRLYRAHRLAYLYMTGVWPTAEIDHKDTDRSNNRWHNLREATSAQNSQNSGRQKRNISGFKGVSRYGRRWCAMITANGERYRSGSFRTPEEAAYAYAAAAKHLHGEFARFDLAPPSGTEQFVFDFGGG
jgi:hypothetical protein